MKVKLSKGGWAGETFQAYGSMRRSAPSSADDASVDLRRLRLRFGVFFSSMWLLYALLRLNFPLPVTLNRFAAARCVFIFGTLIPPRTKYHGHVFAFQFGLPLDCRRCQCRRQLFEQHRSELRMRQFSSAKHYRRLDFVAFRYEFCCRFQLHVKIVIFDAGTQFNFLHRNDLLLLACFLLAFLLFVTEFAEVHYAADGRSRLRCYLHQVEMRVLSHAKGVARRHYSQRLAVDSRNPHLSHMNFIVDPWLLSDDLAPPIMLHSRSSSLNPTVRLTAPVSSNKP